MPIIDIEMVTAGNGPETPAALDLSRLADALGKVLRSPPMGTWVRLRFLPATQYAENDAAGSPFPRPVFVKVLKAQLPAEEQLAREMQAVTQVVASLLERPAENVHVLYEPEAAGRIAFGGLLRRR